MPNQPLTAAQLSLGLRSHNNHYLFSDHYLNYILKTDPRWQSAVSAADAFLTWVTALYQREKDQLAHYSESQLEDHWFKPIFQQLGHIYEGQTAVPGLSLGIKFPDYVLFPDDNARRKAVADQRTADAAQLALALAEVKAWNVPLGKKSGGKPSFDNNNPSYQIDYYLRAAELQWGILSNGRLWRLVHKESSYKLDIYFEIDLEQAIIEQNRAAALFFVLFFRQTAFRPDSHGRIFLQDALAESAAYAVQLENDLRDSAYKALERLIQGFIEPGANNLTAADLPTIYANSLYLLYRILFLFYGESRGLLPMANPQYQNYSLTQLARDIADQFDKGQTAPPMTSRHWHRLKTLFSIINGDQPDLNRHLGVPRYNGGLFNPDRHPFLERYFVGDRYLMTAIDVLARREVGHKKSERRRENVDYRTLGVRQLGSIYEGLLEYQPRRAAEPMAAVKKGKGEEWLPLSQKPKRANIVDSRETGDVYLVTDKGERKATGSYYTPDYIVKYIVEQTLGPLVKQVKQQIESHTDPAASFVREILKLNILDPAMGSGHFLVEATDFLARAIATDENVARAAAAEDEDDLTYWRRQVVEACIYGVDKNPMAVELAKLSLWLVTVARDKPLSFLDHHLQHGDSLVGARLADLNALPTAKKRQTEQNQPPLLDETALTQDAFRAVGGMMTIEKILTNAIEDIHHKEKLLADLRAHLQKWRQIADLWTSAAFGNDMTAEEYADLLRHLQGKEAMMNDSQRQPFLTHPARQQNDYFHWELAFPEVFFDEYGRPLGPAAGFDAIIGNPPYVRQEGMSDIKPFLSQSFAEVYRGNADLYIFFYQQSLDLLKVGGLTALIVTNKWLRTGYGDGLRKYLAKNAEIQQIIDFGHAPIFQGVDVFPTIVKMRKPDKASPKKELITSICLFPREELKNVTVEAYVKQNKYSVSMKRFGSTAWSLEPEEVADLMDKLRRVGKPLSEFGGFKPMYGIKTGFNQAFLIDDANRQKIIHKDPKSVELIKPTLRGQDIKRWRYDWSGVWIILLKSSENWTWPWSNSEANEAEKIFEQTYPAIYEYFLPFKENLLARWDQGRFWWELRSCAYYDAFSENKIIHTDITWRPQFAFADQEIYLLNTAYMWPTNDLYLLAVVNSPLLWSYMWRNAVHGKDEALRMIHSFVETLPIAVPTDEIRRQAEANVSQLLKITKDRQDLFRNFLDWLQVEFLIKKLGQKLEDFASLNEDDFLAEVKRRKPQDSRLSPTDIKALRQTYAEYRPQIQAILTETEVLEHKLSDLVNQTYGLTEKEKIWLWETAPPRMPIDLQTITSTPSSTSPLKKSN